MKINTIKKILGWLLATSPITCEFVWIYNSMSFKTFMTGLALLTAISAVIAAGAYLIVED